MRLNIDVRMIRGGKPNVPRRALSRIKTCKLAFVAAPCNMYIQNIDGIGDRSNPVRGQMKKASESKRASIGFRSGAHLPTFTYPPHSFAANFLCAPPISLAPTHIHTHTHTHTQSVNTPRGLRWRCFASQGKYAQPWTRDASCIPT